MNSHLWDNHLSVTLGLGHFWYFYLTFSFDLLSLKKNYQLLEGRDGVLCGAWLGALMDTLIIMSVRKPATALEGSFKKITVPQDVQGRSNRT